MVNWFLLSSIVIALVGYMTWTGQRLAPLRRRRPPIDLAQLSFTPEVVKFRARGEVLTIAAWHFPAPGAAQAVVIAYDSGTWRGRRFAASAPGLATDLIRNGFTMLMLDLRDPSERSATRVSYASRERRDLLGAVDWLLERGYSPDGIGVSRYSAAPNRPLSIIDQLNLV